MLSKAVRTGEEKSFGNFSKMQKKGCCYPLLTCLAASPTCFVNNDSSTTIQNSKAILKCKTEGHILFYFLFDISFIDR